MALTTLPTSSLDPGVSLIDWDSSVKTSSFNAAVNIGYWIDTTSGSVTVTLPSSANQGDTISFADYAENFNTNSVIVSPNGLKIKGSTSNAVLTTGGQVIQFVYSGAPQGWIISSTGLASAAGSPTYITATGGTITTSGDYKIHTFTSSGTFTVTEIGNEYGSNELEYVVVAGGAGAGSGGSVGNGAGSGGGGAGGYRSSVTGESSGGGSSAETAITAVAQGYTVTIGGGGAGGGGTGGARGSNGSNSVFGAITSTGGGGGGGDSTTTGASGGSGGGGAWRGSAGGGAGTTNQGYAGATGNTPSYRGGGGGGAGEVGGTDQANVAGGDGVQTSINGTPTYFAGGGGGGGGNFPGGEGGGGNGGDYPNTGQSGTVNTGGGGGGNYFGAGGGAGGSGIVIIRYKFQN